MSAQTGHKMHLIVMDGFFMILCPRIGFKLFCNDSLVQFLREGFCCDLSVSGKLNFDHPPVVYRVCGVRGSAGFSHEMGGMATHSCFSMGSFD